jgi:hypothetical protein
MKRSQTLPIVLITVLAVSSFGLSAFRLLASGNIDLGSGAGQQWTKEQYQDWLKTARYPDWEDYENPAEFRQSVNDYFWSIEQAYPEKDLCCAAEWAKQRLDEDISNVTAEVIASEFSAEEISWLILEGVLGPS